MTTRVIHIRDSGLEPRRVYIGRGSKWGNPFKIGRDGTRAEVIKKYIALRGSDPEFIAAICNELKDKTLVCYCKPLACHGDWLAEVADGTF